MKAKLVLLVAGLQILLLAFMAGQREWILHTGTPLTLRTAPIDPTDPMRGSYVRLDYEISTVSPALCHGEVAKWVKTSDYRESQKLRDRVVYAFMELNDYGIAEIAMLSDEPPENDIPFIRGRVVSADTSGIRVRYGIEAQFMQKDAAQRMESMTIKEKAGAPINAQIAVGPSGIAVLKSTTWEPLGITIAFDRPTPRETRDQAQPGQPQPLTGLTVTLHNYGDHDLAIVNLPDARSFRMVQNTRILGGNYIWVGEKSTEQPTPKAEDIIVIKPGDKHSVHLDLTQPKWWVADTRKPGSAPIPLLKLTDGWSANFRFEYAPPSAEAVWNLPHADLIRHAPLRSRAFNANQGMD